MEFPSPKAAGVRQCASRPYEQNFDKNLCSIAHCAQTMGPRWRPFRLALTGGERVIQIAFGRSSPLRGALRASKTLARFDSDHPWSSPSLCSGRFAVQIGNPADLCRTEGLIFIRVRQTATTVGRPWLCQQVVLAITDCGLHANKFRVPATRIWRPTCTPSRCRTMPDIPAFLCRYCQVDETGTSN